MTNFAVARRMMGERQFGDAGARVVIEERLTGREVSMMAFCDGTRLALLASAEDHKAVGDGDTGPNTGGMGTYSPSPLVGYCILNAESLQEAESLVRGMPIIDSVRSYEARSM